MCDSRAEFPEPVEKCVFPQFRGETFVTVGAK